MHSACSVYVVKFGMCGDKYAAVKCVVVKRMPHFSVTLFSEGHS